jgi:hypothetical protein
MNEYKGTIYITNFELLSDFKIKAFINLNKSSKSIINNLSSSIIDNSIILKINSKNFYRYYKKNSSTKINYNDFKYISEVYGLCSIIKNNDEDDYILKSITIKEEFNFIDNTSINDNLNSINSLNSLNLVYLNKFPYRKDTIKQNIMNIFNS